MARYKDGHKQEARDAIIKNAAERFRRDGIAGTGVRALMADAGLTHGAFYAHFSSRAELVASAIEYGAESTREQFETVLATVPGDQKLQTFISSYLRRQHGQQMGLGCTAAALAPDIARENSDTRARFTAQTERLVHLISDLLPEGGTQVERATRAKTVFALMMGVLQLMRIETSPDAIERLMHEGRTAALSLANQPW
ncbi:TetR/AcrR family transcriptional regulator [Aquidulcibacter sp.]|uniref:TetR/AcrR family transcriptional regulator n=1 Tax=Aquidulcibacter sp. TaxID=2052990 RepID=UPI0022C4A362|nr:TetR/AcrR family transcriptional regulator [Aquidulcibacter sp.]